MHFSTLRFEVDLDELYDRIHCEISSQDRNEASPQDTLTTNPTHLERFVTALYQAMKAKRSE